MYSYEAEKPKLFTDEGQREFLKVRDAAKKLLATAGAFRMAEVLSAASIGGDSWFQIACVDRLVELGEIFAFPNQGCMTQHKVYRSTIDY